MKPSIETIKDMHLCMFKPGKKYETIGELLTVERLDNSVMGNPRFSCAIDTECAYDIMLGKTKADVMWAYAMPKENTVCKVWFHITKTGNIIFDCIEPLTANDC